MATWDDKDIKAALGNDLAGSVLKALRLSAAAPQADIDASRRVLNGEPQKGDQTKHERTLARWVKTSDRARGSYLAFLTAQEHGTEELVEPPQETPETPPESAEEQERRANEITLAGQRVLTAEGPSAEKDDRLSGTYQSVPYRPDDPTGAGSSSRGPRHGLTPV